MNKRPDAGQRISAGYEQATSTWMLPLRSRIFHRSYSIFRSTHSQILHPPLSLPTKPLLHQKEPILWVSDYFERDLDDIPNFGISLETLHSLIHSQKFASAHRIRCTLQDQGVQIPNDIVFLDAAFGELNTLSKATYDAFYGWCKLLPAKTNANARAQSNNNRENPFLPLVASLLRSGSPSTHMTCVLSIIKIASSKGYFIKEFKRIMPLLSRMVKPNGGAIELMRELEESYVGWVKTTVDMELNTSRDAEKVKKDEEWVTSQIANARKTLILACCEVNGRWMRIANRLITMSDREGIYLENSVKEFVKGLSERGQGEKKGKVKWRRRRRRRRKVKQGKKE
ncbi:hypothetical protein BDP27DRAFT_930947 [Rhodocollybia butyracea]|uniref:Uncharacterized protein n=1 Tax=Rhodocollybia butyracea TaxID=206335 RepID=A0A9P5PKF7_9AGAR|nr:hypothetical protein BDP27DRAFT_930947 [Rhodocollybia butyracea]